MGSLFCLLAVTGYALTPAQALVEKMAESSKAMSYKGYFTYDRGQYSSSFYLVHLADAKADKQRLVFLDGEPLEIINDGHSFSCIHSGDRSIQSARHGDLDSFLKLNKSLGSIWQHYDADIVAETRVADRSVLQIELKPKDQHRYPFVFFIDNETGLMLKMLILDVKGQPLERFHYVKIEYEGVTEDDLKPSIKNYTSVDHAPVKSDLSSNISTSRWQLTWIPAGFLQDKIKINNWYKKVHNESVFMYSDGLSTFSVFVEQTDQPAMSGISKRIGSTSAISYYLTEGAKVFLVTVVGEIPIITADQIAMSVRAIK